VTATLGRAALVGALVACVAAVWVSWLGTRRRRPALVEAGTGLLAGAAALAVAAMAALAWALLTGDFTLRYVALATSRSMTWPYRLGSLWGGMEGSLLLWCAFLTGGAALAGRALRRRAPDLYGGAQAVLGLVGAGALVLPLALADPFARLAVPALDGGGLTPILEHPAMLYHPPILYLGQTALAIPFALTVAALALGRLDGAWLALTRRFALVAWVALSAGLVAGAHWAYQELGWGGFWGWDPVENAGLLPWLATTAFLHAALIAEHRSRRGREVGEPASASLAVLAPASAVGAWTAALAFASFALGLLGVYLTRSGATGSVHAFAEARAVGVALLVGVGAVVAAGVGLFVRGRRFWAQKVPPVGLAASGREAALVANNALLIGCLLVVATGTLFPLVREAFGGPDSLVAPRYFTSLAAPFALAALALAGVGPLLPWSGRRPAGSRRLIGVAAGGALAGVTLITGFGLASPITLPAGAAAGTTIVLSLVRLFRPGARRSRARARALGAAVAHLGLAVALLGVAGSTQGTRAASSLAPGDEVTVGRYRLVHEGVTDQAGDRRRSVRVRVAVLIGDHRVATLRPGLDTFAGQDTPLPEGALRSTPREDLLLTAGVVDPGEGTALITAFIRPLVAWVWTGGLLLVAGGALALGGPTGGDYPPDSSSRPAGAEPRFFSRRRPSVADPEPEPAATLSVPDGG
jgi:cytochrome c-type biogenesis protein CcmF